MVQQVRQGQLIRHTHDMLHMLTIHRPSSTRPLPRTRSPTAAPGARCCQPSCPAAFRGHAFIDFDGCFALKCSMCPCHFCGWCLADCGGDAHAHVRSCRHKPAGANDPYFGTKEQFEEAHRQQQRGKLRSYLNQQVDASLQRDVVEACRVELERNRLWPVL